jgi:hypothetical protein
MIYGSDTAGLVCAYIFAAGGLGMPITSDEAVAWLAGQPAPSERLLAPEPAAGIVLVVVMSGAIIAIRRGAP